MDVVRDLVAAARERWHTRGGLALALAVFVGITVPFLAGFSLASLSAPEWLFVVVVCLVIAVVWWHTRLPRARRGRVGVAVALVYESKDLERALRADFVERLRDLLSHSSLRHKFELLELPERLSHELRAEPEAASRYMLRMNVHFLLMGRARVRPSDGTLVRVLDLSARVRHRGVPQDVAKQFSSDFGAVWPTRVVVPEGEFFLSEVAASHIDAVARYVIGTAAALSNDLGYAEELLCDAERRIEQLLAQANRAIPLTNLLDMVRQRIRRVLEGQLYVNIQRHRLRREIDGLHQAEQVIEKLRRYEPDHYGARLAAATCAFLLRRDVTAAMREIAACQGREDGAWLYSKAFLLAYGGDLDGAYRAYRAAFEAPLNDSTVPVQCEEFIEKVLQEEPERKWLYYCLGLINHRAKGDLSAAKTDFERFLASAEPRHNKQSEAARIWLSRLG